MEIECVGWCCRAYADQIVSAQNARTPEEEGGAPAEASDNLFDPGAMRVPYAMRVLSAMRVPSATRVPCVMRSPSATRVLCVMRVPGAIRAGDGRTGRTQPMSPTRSGSGTARPDLRVHGA